MTDSILDNKILQILLEDARTAPAEIAVRLGMSEEEVRNEIHRLEEERIILGYNAVLNSNKAFENRVSCLIEVKVQPEREKGFEKIAERIARYEEVRSLFLVSGAYDLLVVLEVASIQEVSFFVMERLATLPGVVSTSTHFLLKTYKDHGTILVEEEGNHRLPITL
jgi:DNA-binding Lrp family transcriptional regulator